MIHNNDIEHFDFVLEIEVCFQCASSKKLRMLLECINKLRKVYNSLENHL